MWTQDEKRREHSYVNDYFSGDLLVQMQCSKCGYQKFSFDKFGDLVLNMDVTTGQSRRSVTMDNYRYGSYGLNNTGTSGVKNLNALISEYFKTEEIEDFLCQSCKKKCTVYKKTSIWTFPYTLFLYLKRFEYYPHERKRQDKVFVPETSVSLTNFKQTTMDDMQIRKVIADFGDGREYKMGEYKIKGYVEHYGEINHGHYISYCENGNTWVKFNDDKVTKVNRIESEDPFSTGSSEVYILALELRGKK